MAEAARARDRLHFVDQRRAGGAAREVLFEEDDPGDLALADRLPQPRSARCRRTGDDPLAGQLRRRQRAGDALGACGR